MLAMNWAKIDKFYIVLAGVLLLLALVVIFTVKGVFSGFLTASELSRKDISSQLRVDRNRLQEAYKFAFNEENVPLEIR